MSHTKCSEEFWPRPFLGEVRKSFEKVFHHDLTLYLLGDKKDHRVLGGVWGGFFRASLFEFSYFFYRYQPFSGPGGNFTPPQQKRVKRPFQVRSQSRLHTAIHGQSRPLTVNFGNHAITSFTPITPSRCKFPSIMPFLPFLATTPSHHHVHFSSQSRHYVQLFHEQAIAHF